MQKLPHILCAELSGRNQESSDVVWRHRPAKLQRLVEGIAAGSSLPLTVKIRIGPKATNINADKVWLWGTAPVSALHSIALNEMSWFRPAVLHFAR